MKLSPACKTNPKLLVIIANQPGYTPNQLANARQSFCDLNNYLARSRRFENLNVSWRFGPRSPNILPEDLYGSVENEIPLFEALKSTDYVIASPSTAVLEAMSMDIPTCIIEYSNLPDFVQAAWMIRSGSSIDQEFDSLIQSPENRIVYQRYLLHDQMRIDSLATPRVCSLIQDMICLSNKSVQIGVKVDYSKIRVCHPDFSCVQPYSYKSLRKNPARSSGFPP